MTEDNKMRGKYVGDRHSLIARATILIASFIALVFFTTAVSLQPGFYSDGTGGVSDGMPLASVSIFASDPAR